MPIPIAVPIVGAILAVGTVLALQAKKKNTVITALPPGQPSSPPVATLPPPVTVPGQAPTLPPGFAQQANGNVVPIITSSNGTQFLAASSPESIGPPPEIIRGQDLTGMIMTVDVGVARLNVQGIQAGNMLMVVTGNLDSNNNMTGKPTDPRLPTNLPDIKVPLSAVSGFADK